MLIVGETVDVGSFPLNFLLLAVCAMEHLKGRKNVEYSLTKALRTLRKDKSDLLMLAKAVPMGLIEYSANLFTTTSIQNI